MRALLITWNYPPKVGGMEMMLNELVQSLRRQIEVQVVAPAAGDHALPNEEPNTLRTSHPALLGFMLEALRLGRGVLRRDEFDVLIAGSALVAPIVFLLGRLFKIPTVVNVYGLDIIYPHPLYQGMVRALLPRFDRVVAISQAARQLVVDRGVAPERVTIVHPGIRFSEFETQPDRAKLREDLDLQGRLVLLIAGRLAKRKGVLEFVHFALPAIVDRHPETLLVVAGGNPTDSLSHKEDIQSLLRREIREQGLEDHVRLLGRVKRAHLVKLFQACDLFILPAIPVEGDMEGFGIVLVEASAAGKPVVSTRLGGIPDAVAEGESGVLVEPEAWEALVAAITSLLADEGARRELGASGRRRARTKLDWSVIGERYAEGLREVVGAGPIEESFALHHDQKEGR